MCPKNPCQHLCKILKHYIPGEEIELYRKIIQECRLYLQESLLMKDRKRITRIYLKALEKLFKIYTKFPEEKEVPKVNFQPSVSSSLERSKYEESKDLSPSSINERMKSLKKEMKRTRNALRQRKKLLHDQNITNIEQTEIKSDVIHLRKELAFLKVRMKDLECVLRSKTKDTIDSECESSISQSLITSLNIDLNRCDSISTSPSRSLVDAMEIDLIQNRRHSDEWSDEVLEETHDFVDCMVRIVTLRFLLTFDIYVRRFSFFKEISALTHKLVLNFFFRLLLL